MELSIPLLPQHGWKKEIVFLWFFSLITLRLYLTEHPSHAEVLSVETAAPPDMLPPSQGACELVLRRREGRKPAPPTTGPFLSLSSCPRSHYSVGQTPRVWLPPCRTYCLLFEKRCHLGHDIIPPTSDNVPASAFLVLWRNDTSVGGLSIRRKDGRESLSTRRPRSCLRLPTAQKVAVSVQVLGPSRLPQHAHRAFAQSAVSGRLIHGGLPSQPHAVARGPPSLPPHPCCLTCISFPKPKLHITLLFSYTCLSGHRPSP